MSDSKKAHNRAWVVTDKYSKNWDKIFKKRRKKASENQSKLILNDTNGQESK